jgi:nucleotide-binding universal stress UspA family protein
MFKHVLLPIDGSELSRKAVGAAIEFVRQLGAKLTTYHALERSRANIYGEGIVLDEVSIEAIDAREREAAKRYLAEVLAQAEAAGVDCEVKMTRVDSPYRGIIDAANDSACDVIFMASHGRGEFAALLLGSTTLKVLSHSRIPVLVHR